MSLTSATSESHFTFVRLTVVSCCYSFSREVSAVQALFCCMTGMTICTYSCSRNMLRTSHYISEAYAWFGAAYFFYDIWSMYRVEILKRVVLNQAIGALTIKKTGIRRFLMYIRDNPVIVIHHVFIGCFGFLFITVSVSIVTTVI